MASPDLADLHESVLDWYADNQRDLPWRRPDVGGWAVLVSEVMLQQTPVSRVLPAYESWMRRWPTPAALAVEPPGEAVRMWGRLGYPRRALRLHAAAMAIERDHDGELPDTYDELRALPGVGDYTANAVLAFAHRQRAAVLDTNVRRLHARLLDGQAAAGPSVRAAERSRAFDLLPGDAERAATWSVAVMELGALVCVAGSPRCDRCPVAAECAWRSAGRPPLAGPSRRAQTYAGTDRQCRGRILALLRDGDDPVAVEALGSLWDDSVQRARALASLVQDGLLVEQPDGTVRLP